MLGMPGCLVHDWTAWHAATVACVFFKEVVQKHCNYIISDMLCYQSVANSGVFATPAFLVVVKTS